MFEINFYSALIDDRNYLMVSTWEYREKQIHFNKHLKQLHWHLDCGQGPEHCCMRQTAFSRQHYLHSLWRATKKLNCRRQTAGIKCILKSAALTQSNT